MTSHKYGNRFEASERRELDRQMIDAIRECLGLLPLYEDAMSRATEKRLAHRAKFVGVGRGKGYSK